jgi:hypothetical protein
MTAQLSLLSDCVKEMPNVKQNRVAVNAGENTYVYAIHILQ